jgi:hypothetical protein
MTLEESDEGEREEREWANEPRDARGEHHVVRCPKSPPA